MQYRPFSLDGAMSWFDPRTGLHLRLDAPSTRSLRRTVPRVVLFGITNHCNLRCGFCSRDTEQASVWTADSAFGMLSQLSAAGVAEVAFGGGEPLSWKPFDGLVRRLAEHTSVALHLTTNGVLLTSERLRGLMPHLSEIRLSLYEDTPWRERAALLSDHGQRWGANVLVGPRVLNGLMGLLEELAQLGCRDVALLSYVGSDPAEQLSDPMRRRLADIIRQSPLAIRVSACWGDTLGVPKLFREPGGDCGAGRDFVVLGSDRRLKGCSFQDQSVPIESAAHLIELWRRQMDRADHSLSAASKRIGCTRRAEPAAPSVTPAATLPVWRIWQSFSANNSGDCVLVGRFKEVSGAQALVRELFANFHPGAPYSDEWRTLLTGEGIPIGDEECSPDTISRLGATILMHTDMAIGDDFPALRALLWKRGGRAVYNGIHVHESLQLVAGLGLPNQAQAIRSATSLNEMSDTSVVRRHNLVFASLPMIGPRTDHLAAQCEALQHLAQDHQAALSGEIVVPSPDRNESPPNWAKALSTPPATNDTPTWLWIRFATEDQAKRFGERELGRQARVAWAAKHVVMCASQPTRTGRAAQMSGGMVTMFQSSELMVRAVYWQPRKRGAPTVDPSFSQPEAVAALRARLPNQKLTVSQSMGNVVAEVITSAPDLCLVELVAFGQGRELSTWVEPSASSGLMHAAQRIRADLQSQLVRKRR